MGVVVIVSGQKGFCFRLNGYELFVHPFVAEACLSCCRCSVTLGRCSEPHLAQDRLILYMLEPSPCGLVSDFAADGLPRIHTASMT